MKMPRNVIRRFCRIKLVRRQSRARQHKGGRMAQDVAQELQSDTRNLLEQLKLHLDVYKTHFDIFVKGTALYFAALGAIAGFMYRDGATQASQVALSSLVIGGSLTYLAGCVVSLRWVFELERSVREAEKRLGISPFPFSGAKGVIGMVSFACILFVLFGIVTLRIAVK